MSHDPFDEDSRDPFSTSNTRFTSGASGSPAPHVKPLAARPPVAGGTPRSSQTNLQHSVTTPSGRSDPCTPRPDGSASFLTTPRPLGDTASSAAGGVQTSALSPSRASATPTLAAAAASGGRRASDVDGTAAMPTPGATAASAHTPRDTPDGPSAEDSLTADAPHHTATSSEGSAPSAPSPSAAVAATGDVAAITLPKRGWFDRRFRPTQFDELEKQSEEEEKNLLKAEKEDYHAMRSQYKLFVNWVLSMLKKHESAVHALEKEESKAVEHIEKEQKEERSKLEKSALKALKAIPEASKVAVHSPSASSTASSGAMAAAAAAPGSPSAGVASGDAAAPTTPM